MFERHAVCFVKIFVTSLRKLCSPYKKTWRHVAWKTRLPPWQTHNITYINIMLTNSVVNETPVRTLAVSPMSVHVHSIINNSVRQGQHPKKLPSNVVTFTDLLMKVRLVSKSGSQLAGFYRSPWLPKTNRQIISSVHRAEKPLTSFACTCCYTTHRFVPRLTL
jgi:hypothetical protein